MSYTLDNTLWGKIEAFDLNQMDKEYGFFIRLATENYWTQAFTTQAILEYKKFMYMAATSDKMVSPSHIVDVVWHQHLIFTKEYQEFCDLIGKQIQHIPSTHDKKDFVKFETASYRTEQMYNKVFGDQPRPIWDHNSMYDSLNLEKAQYKLRSKIVIGLFILFAITPFAYESLRPMIQTINTPLYFLGVAILFCAVFLFLEIFNRYSIKRIVNGFDKSSFIYDLNHHELVYLKEQNIEYVVHGVMNQLVDEKYIKVESNHKLVISKNIEPDQPIEMVKTMAILPDLGTSYYAKAILQLKSLHFIKVFENSMEAFKKYVKKSKKFHVVFFVNFVMVALAYMLLVVRLITGISRDKPVLALCFIMLMALFGIATYFLRVINLVCTFTIPKLYNNVILTADQKKDKQWQFFLLGTGALGYQFYTLIEYIKRNGGGNSSGDSCGSSCGSSCSSCSSCGGCGD